MNVELTVLIGVCGTVIGAVLGILGYRRNARRDIAAEAKDGGVMMMELRYIREGVEEIKRIQREQTDKHDRLSERVTRVEESVKQAHKRLNKLEEVE
nr:hypothetical protein [Maliibacterium massiliense]